MPCVQNVKLYAYASQDGCFTESSGTGMGFVPVRIFQRLCTCSEFGNLYATEDLPLHTRIEFDGPTTSEASIYSAYLHASLFVCTRSSQAQGSCRDLMHCSGSFASS
eukprot:756078-Pelagomonas_calceolata.AAC.1